MLQLSVKALVLSAVLWNCVNAYTDRLGPELARHTSDLRDLRQGSGTDFRLRNESRPIHYDVNLRTMIDLGHRTFTGNVDILIETLRETSSIVLNSNDIVVLNISYKLATAGDDEFIQLEETSYALDEYTQLLEITVDRILPANTEYVVRIEFEGYHGSLYGFYLSTYMENGVQKYLGTTQFQAVSARRAFPCYDEPRFRATFTISINHIGSFHAVSNMPGTEAADPEDADRTITTFERTPSMPTYLVAFVVSEFAHTRDENERRPHQVFSEPLQVNYTDFALENSVLLLNELEDYFQVNYTLPKMDQFAIPDFAAGAMENWGIVTYRPVYLLLTPGVPANRREVIASIIAHEYAHQFFGNLVTPEWWSYLWLNEGYATLYENYLTDRVHPEFDLKNRFPADILQYVLWIDTTDNVRPMSYYVDSPALIERLFDVIAYLKSGCVLRMLNYFMGEQNYQIGLNHYLTSVSRRTGNDSGVAIPDDLFSALQESMVERNLTYLLPEGVTLNDIMNSWSTQSGHPILNVMRNYETNETVLSQRRATNIEATTIRNNTYYIGYTFTTEDELNFESTETRGWLLNNEDPVVLTTEDGVPSNDQWIIFNIRQVGLYRVNYDDNNWLLLTEELKSPQNRIGTLNHAQLVDDSYSLAYLGHLDWDIALEIQETLSLSSELIPWISGQRIFEKLSNHLRYSDINPYFESMARSLVSRIYLRYAPSNLDELQYNQLMGNSIALKLACKFGTRACLERAEKLILEEIVNGTDIHTEIRENIYCAGLKTENNEIADYLTEKITNIQHVKGDERDMMKRVLECAQTAEHVDKVLEAYGTFNFTPTERVTVMIGMAQNSPSGASAILDVLVENAAHLKPVATGEATQNLLRELANAIGTEEQLEKFETILTILLPTEGEMEVPELTRAAEDARALIKSNQAWLEKHGPAIKSWLVQHYDISFAPSMKLSGLILGLSLLIAVLFNL